MMQFELKCYNQIDKMQVKFKYEMSNISCFLVIPLNYAKKNIFFLDFEPLLQFCLYQIYLKLKYQLRHIKYRSVYFYQTFGVSVILRNAIIVNHLVCKKNIKHQFEFETMCQCYLSGTFSKHETAFLLTAIATHLVHL